MLPMKNFLLIATVLAAGCGQSSVDNELTGQVKRVKHVTPIICGNYSEVDVSLGVLRNGVGSMSKEDIWLLVEDKDQVTLLEKAAKDGDIVKVTYDVQRLTFCVPDHTLKTVEIVADPNTVK